ncbi:hypothetical protein D3C78_1291270 [compost metagenome]
MRDDFSGIRADRDSYFDEDTAPRRSRGGKPQREKNLALQIALGIWMGGVALALTGLAANFLFAGLLTGAIQIGVN